MKRDKKYVAGRVLSLLIGLFLVAASAVPKFVEWEGKAEMMGKMGIPLEILPSIGALEIIVTLLYLVPRTSFIGAVLLTGYLGGAVMTHVRVGEPWYVPVGLGVLAWSALALRRPEIFTLATTGDRPATTV